MKRILYILANEPTGGVGAVVKNYTTRFDERISVDFLIYTEARNTPFQTAVKRDDNEIYYLPELGLSHLPELIRQTDQFFLENGKKYDVVHLHYTGISLLCLPPARKAGIPHVIVHSHNTRLSDSAVNNIRNKFLSDLGMKYANHYMACSRNAAEYLFGKKAVDRNEVYYLHNAIEVCRFRYSEKTHQLIRKKMGLENKKVVLNIGRLEEQKNLSSAINIFAEMCKKKDNLIFLIAGVGKQKDNLKQICETMHLTDKVRFLGFVNNADELMIASDLLLMPSFYEGFPVSVVEAQASGLPCLISDNITDEVKLCDVVHYLSLNDPETLWAEEGLKLMEQPRTDHSTIIAEEGYSIEKEAKKLEEYYLNL